MKSIRLLLVAATAFITLASSASAQSIDSDRAGLRSNLISSNPFGLLFEWYQGEYERALSPAFSVAVAFAAFNLADDDVSSIDGIVRYYPSGRAVRGFSIGGSVGYAGVEEEVCDNFDCGNTIEYSAFTVGIRGDYVWLLGREQHLAVAAGLGAKRLISDNIDGIEGLPVARLSLGYAW